MDMQRVRFIAVVCVFVGFFVNQAQAYDPFSKLECRKRLSATQFLYFEVQPITFKGHPLELDLFENDQLIYQKTALLDAVSNNDILQFQNDDTTITVEVNHDYLSKLELLADPQIKVPVLADCIYYVPIPEVR
jgi:hypothetical protein